jgi:HD superfamily phosphohydrolase
MKRKNLRVPNQDIKILGHELLFINTKCFQRLFKIKQLGLADKIYPFATHTRAAHSLDCLAVSQLYIDALIENLKEEKDDAHSDDERKKMAKQVESDAELIRAVALLHDTMHIPFSHTLEDENRVLEKGDKGIRIDKMINRIQTELEDLKNDKENYSYLVFGYQNYPDFEKDFEKCIHLLNGVRRALWTIGYPDDASIKKAISGIEKKSQQTFSEEYRATAEEEIKSKRLNRDEYYIADIIGNTITADLLSYIRRDVEFTGIEMKPGFLYRLFDYIELRKLDNKNRIVIKLTKRGEWRQDILSSIISILNVRFALTEAVLFHHAKCEASSMLGKIAYLCNLSESEELYEIGDEGFMLLLEDKIKNLENKENAKAAKHLLDSLNSRRLYKRFHIIPAYYQDRADGTGFSKYTDPEVKFGFENEIEKKFGLPSGSIILFSCKTALKEVEALVVYETKGEDGKLKENIEKLNSKNCMENLEKRHTSLAMRVRNVEEQYKALWKLYVFINPTLIPFYGASIKHELLLRFSNCTDAIFDETSIFTRKDYKASSNIENEIIKLVPLPEKESVLKEIIQASTEIQMKNEVKSDKLVWLTNNANAIVIKAVENYKDKKIPSKQGELKYE